MLARDQENLGAEQQSWKPAVLFCFLMSLIRPFHCFSFSRCQTPLGKEMSAHKLSHLAWLEEKTPVTFYQGHIPMYWASHTHTEQVSPSYLLLSRSVSHALHWKVSANCLIPHASSSLPCPQLDLGPLNQIHLMSGCTEELWLGGCLIILSSIKSC